MSFPSLLNRGGRRCHSHCWTVAHSDICSHRPLDVEHPCKSLLVPSPIVVHRTLYSDRVCFDNLQHPVHISAPIVARSKSYICSHRPARYRTSAQAVVNTESHCFTTGPCALACTLILSILTTSTAPLAHLLDRRPFDLNFAHRRTIGTSRRWREDCSLPCGDVFCDLVMCSPVSTLRGANNCALTRSRIRHPSTPNRVVYPSSFASALVRGIFSFENLPCISLDSSPRRASDRS